MVHLVDDHRRRSGGAALLDCIVDPAVPLLGLGARGVLGHEGIDPFVDDLEPGVRRGGAVGRAGIVSLHVALARFGQGDLRLGDLRADEAAEGDPRHSLSSGFQSPLGGSDQLLCLSAELIAPEAAGVHGLVGLSPGLLQAAGNLLVVSEAQQPRLRPAVGQVRLPVIALRDLQLGAGVLLGLDRDGSRKSQPRCLQVAQRRFAGGDDVAERSPETQNDREARHQAPAQKAVFR